MKSSLLYPGWKLITPSTTAARWTERIGIPFHEVHIETNAYHISLVVSDLLVTRLSDHVDPGINQADIPLV